MKSNWRLEPILAFELETRTGHIWRIKENGEPDRIVQTRTGHIWRIKENGEPDRIVQYRQDVAFKDVDTKKYWADAVYWYKKAALQYEPLAVQMLQCIAEFNAMERKALAGDADAQYYLSCYYFYGYGTYVNSRQGAKWLHHAARCNNRAAIRSIEEWNKEEDFVQAVGDPDFFVKPYFVPECFLMLISASCGKR